MRVAVHQPNYLPWCGFFHKLAAADTLVFLDDVQFPQGRSFVYRSKIGTSRGPAWLSVPVTRHSQAAINEATFADVGWQAKHLRTLQHEYARSPYFSEVMSFLEPHFEEPGTHLATFNMRLIEAVAGYLGLACSFHVASRLGSEGTGDDRLISLVERIGGDCYVSGKGGENYQSPEKFAAYQLALDVREYIPKFYPQVHGDGFEPGLSVIDALFHLGPAARDVVD